MNTISIRRGRGSLDCCCFGACEPCAKAVSVSDTKQVMFTIAQPRKVTNQCALKTIYNSGTYTTQDTHRSFVRSTLALTRGVSRHVETPGELRALRAASRSSSCSRAASSSLRVLTCWRAIS